MLEIIEENPLESEENMGKGQEKAGQKSYVKGKKQEEEPQKEQQQEKAEKKENLDQEEQQNKQIRDMGQVTLHENSKRYKVELLTIIGEVEGHESARPTAKPPNMSTFCPSLP